MPALRYRYQTIEFDNIDIHVKTLRDSQEFSDPGDVALQLGITSSTWSLYGVIWASSKVLAHLMSDYDISNKSILEVGCGVGLASLVLNHRNADITATDYHPEAQSLLSSNSGLNGDRSIPFERIGWSDAGSMLGKFDLIIGSDLLYEPGNAEMLSAFIDQHVKPHCEVIIIDPGRSHRARFSQRMVALGYSHSRSQPVKNSEHTNTYHGQVMRFLR